MYCRAFCTTAKCFNRALLIFRSLYTCTAMTSHFLQPTSVFWSFSLVAQTNQSWESGTHNLYLHLSVCIAIVDAWQWPKQIEINDTNSSGDGETDTGGAWNVRQSVPKLSFQSQCQSGSPQAGSKLSTQVGIFHLCESYSFYFHKNKVKMRDSQQSWTLNTQ